MEITHALQTHGRDPWIVKSRDTYYYCFTDSPDNKRIFIAASTTLSGLSTAEAVCVWQAPDGGAYSAHYWAPELHKVGGRWYIYVAAGEPRRGEDEDYLMQRMHVLAAVSSNPQGEYRYVGKIHDANDRWAIDGTIFSHKGKKYFIWSGWEGEKNFRQVLFITRMKNPWTLSGETVQISAPEHEWEKRSQPYVPGGVNEGPQVLKRKGRIHVLYSASGSWTDNYCLGQLTLVGENPLDPQAWQKHPLPVFASSEKYFGPGHACFIHDSRARRYYIVYHAGARPGAGWETGVHVQEFNWSKDHAPVFGTPQ